MRPTWSWWTITLKKSWAFWPGTRPTGAARSSWCRLKTSLISRHKTRLICATLRTNSKRNFPSRCFFALGTNAALINQYMYYGGTNFGDWAGRQVGNDRSFCITSYDYDAVLPEGQEITAKTLRIGLWCHWARCIEELLLSTDLDQGEQP